METQERIPTLADLEQSIIDAGGTVSKARSYEDEHDAYAFSVETFGANTYGHPRMTAHYNKEHGWLSVPGKATRWIGSK